MVVHSEGTSDQKGKLKFFDKIKSFFSKKKKEEEETTAEKMKDTEKDADAESKKTKWFNKPHCKFRWTQLLSN